MEQKPRSGAGETMGWLFGALLIAIGAVALANQFFPFHFGALIWALIFGGVGVAFFSLSLRNPEQWWAMIPGYVFVFVGAIIMLSQIGLDGELIGMFVVSAIGFPFLYVFLRNREHWWALIPAYTMFVVAGIIGLSYFNMGGGIIAPYIMFAIAFPFFVVYVVDRRNWWALIPGGIMSLIGAGIFMVSFEYVLPVALIVGGVVMLIIQMRRREQANAAELPASGPGADKPRSV